MGRLILVEGNIGAGKSTCLAALARVAAGRVSVFPEPVDRWRSYEGHNLLQKMYDGGPGAAYLFQSCVFVTCSDVNLLPATGELRLHERSIYSAFHCFAQVMRASETLSAAEMAVLTGQFTHLERLHPKVDAIVYLRTTPAVALQRVRARARPEEKVVEEAYLKQLHEAHDLWLLGAQSEQLAPVLVVDADVGLDELQRACVSLLPDLLRACG